MYNSRVDGLLFSLAYDTDNLDHLDVFIRKGIPVVFFDRVSEYPDYINIVIDNFKAGYEVTEHLIKQGCRRIMHIGGDLRRNVYRDRFNGYRKALKDHGIDYRDELLLLGRMDQQGADELVDRMMALDPLPDGVFASNDATAVAVICRLKVAGIRVPEKVCVAGFNNMPISTVIDPNLTTVDYPGQEMGEVAATTLINILKNLSSVSLNTIVLKHALIIRASSTRLK